MRRKRFINVELLIYCIKNTNVFYAVNRNSVHFVDFRSD
nr:MAG TPA: RGL-binding domain protein [Caudoviricetes sp.]